jgi:hypothetical protein
MEDEQAPVFRVSYADMKIIKSRRVAQIVMELALEEAQNFVSAFGLPNPAAEMWFALAGLDMKVVEPKEKRNFEDLPLPQQAALICNNERFWRFLRSERGYKNVHDEQAAADALRLLCGIESRRELETNKVAASAFNHVVDAFNHFII